MTNASTTHDCSHDARHEAEIRAFLDRSYDDVAKDLAQLRALLADVALNLQGGLGALGMPGDESASRMMVSGTLVTTLQFEDLAAQILERASRRMMLNSVFTLEMMFGSVAHRVCPAVPAPDPEAGRLLGEAIAKHRELQRSILARTVNQTSMKPGDVELF